MYRDKTKLCESYNRLGSLNKVATEFGVSKKTILNYMNKFGLERQTPNKDKTPKDRRKNNNYHKGYIITKSGYKMVKAPIDHPKKNNKGYIREHILVMEQHIGRYLENDEVVHHIDRNKMNNDISNLQLMTDYEHKKIHSKEERKKIDFEYVLKSLNDGKLYKELCEELQISEAGLRKKMKRNGYVLPTRKKHL